jgi:prephenate dehydrogenase
VKNFKNQTIVVCPGRGEEWQEWLIDLFNKEQVKIKITSADYHDRMMAVIQGLIHFTTITMAKTLQELGIDIGESREFSSPIYKLRLDMVGRILNQDPALYANIEIMNPMTPEVLSAYLKSTRELFSIVEQKDKEGFCKVFEEAADYLGDFKKEAEEYSNYLIRQLVYKEDSNE